MSTLQRRAIIFTMVTVVAIVGLFSYEPSRENYPQPNVLGSTWYGPVLLLLVPVMLGWMSLGAKTRGRRIFGLVLALVLAAACVFLIDLGYRVTQPTFFRAL
jgi:hypothetical protein